MNVSLLVSYIFWRLTLTAPIGPVNSARLDKGVKNGFWHAWIVGTGSMIDEGIFMMLVYLGPVNFLDIPVIQIFLWLFAAFVMFYSGAESIMKANSIELAFTRVKESLPKMFSDRFPNVDQQPAINLDQAWDLRFSSCQNNEQLGESGFAYLQQRDIHWTGIIGHLCSSHHNRVQEIPES